MKKNRFHDASFFGVCLGFLILTPLSCTLSGNESSAFQALSWEDKMKAFHAGQLSSHKYGLNSEADLLNALPSRLAAYDEVKEEASSITHSNLTYTEVRRIFYRKDGTYLSFQLSDYRNDIPALFQIRSRFEESKNEHKNNLYSSGLHVLTDSAHHFCYFFSDLQNGVSRIEGVWQFRYHLLVLTNEKADSVFCQKAWNLFERYKLPSLLLQ